MIRLGTDIVYIPRIAAAIERFGDRFLQRVYTAAEQSDCGCGAAALNKTAINKLAGRWAAKEAVVKALGTGWRGVGYTDVEIRRQLTGVPQVLLYRQAAALTAKWLTSEWQISLSHDQNYAIATAILIASANNKAPTHS